MNIYTKRWEKLQQRLAQNGWHGMLVTHNVDLFYFTGSLQNGYLFVPTEGTGFLCAKKCHARGEGKRVPHGRARLHAAVWRTVEKRFSAA